MRYKILTVDDSKTVRIIVKKAFKLYDCEIVEAGNGVEGLAIAAKENPDLILLDITMPVMDGIEMLTKLKSDSSLKSIPVIMLTAEGGRDNVLRIAKIGVRDYMVKPFKEDLLIQKVGRIIDLKPLTETVSKTKSIFDPATILVVEDKPTIVTQIQEGLKHTPWNVLGVNTTGEAIDACNREVPDMVLISLSLADEAAFTLFRVIRTNIKTKYTPVFGLAVKTDSGIQQQAQQVGFSGVATKPLDLFDLETKIAKAMNLDTSLRYFSVEEGIFVMRLPDSTGGSVVHEVNNYLKNKVSEAVDSGINRAIIDINKLQRLDMAVIKLLLVTMQTFRELALNYSLVGSTALINECKGYEDTRNWKFFQTIDEARASFEQEAAKLEPAASA